MIKQYWKMLCASNTMKIQAIQMVNGLFMLISPATLPGMPPVVYVICAAVVIVLGLLQKVVRVMPDHGSSLTATQKLKRNES